MAGENVRATPGNPGFIYPQICQPVSLNMHAVFSVFSLFLYLLHPILQFLLQRMKEF
jgi:hypothetical protein